MTQASDTVWVSVLPSMKNFGPTLVKQGGAGAAAGGRTLGRTLGRALVSGVAVAGAGLAAVGTVLYRTGKTFDDVNNTIRVGTGATGDELAKLNDVAKSVGQQVPAEWDKIAETVADLNTRLGLSGDTLDTVAQQYLEAGRILGEDVDIQKTSAAFNAFGIEGEDVSDAMDHLFRVSQATGIGMNDLASSAAKSAPSVQALGFTFEETTGLIGSLDKAGLNSGSMMQYMSRNLKNLAEDGEEPRDTFERVTDEIKTLMAEGDTFGAQELAGEAFGSRNAEQFIKALDDGTLSMGELGEVAGMTEDTILEAGEETRQFGEQWQLFKNNVMVWLEPLATRVFGAINDLMEAAVEGVQNFISAFQGGDIEGRFGEWGAAARGVFDYFRDTVYPILKDVGGYIINDLAPAVANLARGGFSVLESVIRGVASTFQAVSGFIKNNKELLAAVGSVIGIILLPALVRLGIQALATMGTVIASWIGMASAAIINGTKMTGVWIAQQAHAIRAAAVYVARSIWIAGAWAMIGAASIAAGAITAAVWTAQIIRSAVVGAASFVVSAARVVGGWILMSVQSLLHAGRMAAAWFIALGPLGWVTAGIIAIAALVVANWDKIRDWTVRIWTAVRNWIVNMWSSIRERTVGLLRSVVEFIRDRFRWVRDFSRELWQGFRDRIVEAWQGVRDSISSIWTDRIRPILQAVGDFVHDNLVKRFQDGVDRIKGVWDKVAGFFRTPINWVIDTVWNNGLRKAYNVVAGLIGADSLDKVDLLERVPAFAKGGIMGSGLKLVGEEGPELISTGPGWVATARETQSLLRGRDDDFSPAQSRALAGNHPSEAMLPMGGNWLTKGAKWLADATGISDAVDWVRGKLADGFRTAIKPITDKVSSFVGDFGRVGGLTSDFIDWGVDGIADWIDARDKEPAAGEYGGNFQGNPGGFNRPAAGPITSWFGPRWGRLHAGVDIGVPIGSAIRAAWDGVVSKIYGGGMDKRMVLDHGKFATSYLHNSKIEAGLGQEVKGGQIIARSGTAGTGPHLHFEKHVPRWYNPVNSNYLFGGGGPGMFLRDKGGPIYPGLNMVLNKTPHLERTFNDPQFQNLNKMAERVASGEVGPGMQVILNGVDHNNARQNANEFMRIKRRMDRGGKYAAGVS